MAPQLSPSPRGASALVRLRPPRLGRWLLLALAAVVVALAGVVVTSFRSQAVRSTAIVAQLLDVRHLTGDSDALAWQFVAQGTPNFTFSQQLTQDAAGIAGDLRLLRRGRAAIDDLNVEFVGLRQGELTEERLIGAKRLNAAYMEALNSVDPTAQILRASVDRLRAVYDADASRANSRLYWGTLGALGVSALLVALLAAAFVAGRRRALRAERDALERSERRVRALLHKASDAVLVVNAESQITYATGAVRELFSSTPEEIVGQRVKDLLPAAEHARARRLIERAIRSRLARTPSEWSLLQDDGSVRHLEAQPANFLDDADVEGIVITVRDVTARREMEAQLRHQALHDPLTGLPNRTLFEDRVAQALTRLQRTGQAVAVLYVDVDDFKSVNDSLGHAAGDDLLRTIARRIDATLRGSDTAARLGGDEFACLLDSLDDLGEAVGIARRLVASLVPPVVLDGRSVSVQASVGVAHAITPSLTAQELIRNADLAMYTAKGESRGSIALFDDHMLSDVRRRLDLREDVARAIARGELSIDYQPLIELAGSSVVGVEALVRWRHTEYGSIPPEQFIPVAETTGVIVGLGRWVLDHALADLGRWSKRHPRLRMNVNVAPRELLEPDYVDAVAATLARHKIVASRLTLELTESELPDDEDTLRRLQAIAELGVNLSIDDFGSGQSSLARLQQLPVTQIKVDQRFLEAIDESPEHATLVSSMIELGHALGLQMVAEGIERDTQLQVLQTLPCQLGQGFLLGYPQSADAIAQLLDGDCADESGAPVASGLN